MGRDGLVVGVDVGGTALKGALVDAQGRVAVMERRPTGREQGAAVVQNILDFVGGLAATASHGPVVAAGVAWLALGVPRDALTWRDRAGPSHPIDGCSY